MIDDIPHRLGSQLRTARLHRGWTQRGVGARCGISQPAWSRMELGHGGRTTLDDWAMAAGALDLGIAAELVGAPRPDADGRLWQLVERLTEAGGWSTHTDDSGSIRMARTSRREAAVAAIWDVIADVDAATADLLEAIGRERSRRPPDWRIGGVVVIRSRGPNRRRVSEAGERMEDIFPTSGTLWMMALARPDAPMPTTPAYCWASGDASRLTPARLPLIGR